MSNAGRQYNQKLHTETVISGATQWRPKHWAPARRWRPSDPALLPRTSAPTRIETGNGWMGAGENWQKSIAAEAALRRMFDATQKEIVALLGVHRVGRSAQRVQLGPLEAPQTVHGFHPNTISTTQPTSATPVEQDFFL